MPVIDRGGVVGPVVKQTSPLIMVCGDVLELVKVSETIPYVLVAPRFGAVAADASLPCANRRNARNPRLASRAERCRMNGDFVSATAGAVDRERMAELG